MENNNKINIGNLGESATQTRKEQIIIGWDSVEKLGADIFSCIHRWLTEGEIIFAYKNTGGSSSELSQIIIVENLDSSLKPAGDYTVSVITSGYTALLPKVSYEYLEGDVVKNLKDWKVDKDIIEVYTQIIKDIKHE